MTILIVLAVSAFTFIFLGVRGYSTRKCGGTSVVHRKARGDEVRAEQIEIDSH